MYVKFNQRDALAIAAALLKSLTPPILLLIKREDTHKIINAEDVIWATPDEVKTFSLERIRKDAIIFVIYDSKRETLPIELAWQQIVKNNSIVYGKFH